jgi:peptidoglycan hydrolase-like protein with peptidoglycan-binding domain
VSTTPRTTDRTASRGRAIVVGAAALAVLAGCAAERAASAPVASGTVALAPVDSALTAPPPTPPPSATDVATTTTLPATTTTAEATTTTSTTTTTTTTTTLPANIVPVPPVSPPLVAVGQRNGDETARIQWRLLELGFWVSAADGRYGLTTTQAVMAFQKYIGLEASGSVNDDTAAWLSNLDVRPHGRSDTGTLVEIDKSKQLLFFVVDGKAQWILNVSTGNGKEYTEPDKNTPGETITGVSLTPDGLHRVNRERPEGWWEGDLGEIYRPKYFVGGVAVHGSNSVPNYPASHGCVRVTVQAMDWIWDSGILPMGTTVWVHNGAPA